jgi:flagellar basal body-associated protein FliL
MNNPNRTSPVASGALLGRLRSHIALMADHQRHRHAGKLIIESAETIEALDSLLLETLEQRNELRERVIKYIKDHDQDEISTVDGLKFMLDELEW